MIAHRELPSDIKDKIRATYNLSIDDKTGLYYGEKACVPLCLLNQEIYALRGIPLKLVAGSLGVGTKDPFFEFGSLHFRTISDFLSSPYTKQITKGCTIMDAHMWLEDNEGKVYDVVMKHIAKIVPRERRKTVYVRARQVLEGVDKRELSGMGLVYVPADKEFCDAWVKHMQKYLGV
jgi:hypothetical protein